MAIPLHMGIAIGMGMITFGLVMLIGCSSFVSPRLVRMVLDRAGAEQGRGGEESEEATLPITPGRQRPRPRRQGNEILVNC